jgi:hypothetical protein
LNYFSTKQLLYSSYQSKQTPKKGSQGVMFCTPLMETKPQKNNTNHEGNKIPRDHGFNFKQWALSFLHKESNQIKFLWTRGASKPRERERKDGSSNPHV